jgi:hypothetical protein
VEHIWSVLCRLSIVDQQRNNVSLIEAVDSVSFKGELEVRDQQPVVFPFPVELVTLWLRSDPDVPETGQARASFISPEGQLLNPGTDEYTVRLEQFQRFRAMVKFEALPFTSNGTYWFKVQKLDKENEQWIDVSSVPLEIVYDSSVEE